MLQEILRNYADVITHYGEFSSQFIRDNSITAILSDRNGYLIPQEVIDSVDGRIYNTHPSLLPLHRGWQPVFFSVLENTAIGVSIHQVSQGLDKGKIVAQSEIKLSKEDTLKTIHTKCRLRIMEMILDGWHSMMNGTSELTEQSGVGCYHSRVEFENIFPKLADGWNSTPRQVRALYISK
jgi:methionyl-tRNA formyltransferase